jgi:hypothetical protein
MAVNYQAVGGQQAGAAALTVSWPTHQTNDIGILVVETDGAGTNMGTPANWDLIQGPITDVASTAGSKLYAFWRRATSNAEATVSVPDSGDHQIARIYTFRGALEGSSPIDVSTSSTKTTASTTVTIPAVVTTVDNALVVWIVSRPNDTTSTTHFPVATFAGLTGVAEAAEAGSNSGNGGGFTVQYGTEATAGSTGTGTISSLAVSTTNSIIVFALKEKPIITRYVLVT